MLVIVVGYSSYTMIVIRAGAGAPINENDPSLSIDDQLPEA